MDEVRRLEARSLAHARARSRRRRVATIRRRTIHGALALFAILWAIVFVQLASGNDPVLSRSTSQTEQPQTAPAKAGWEPEASSEFEAEPEPEPEFEPEPVPEPEVPVVTSSS
jgi:hypothetical protein